jgi:hypothetical protein
MSAYAPTLSGSIAEPSSGQAEETRTLTRDEVMTAGEVAELLKMPVSTIYQLARRGELPASRLAEIALLAITSPPAHPAWPCQQHRSQRTMAPNRQPQTNKSSDPKTAHGGDRGSRRVAIAHPDARPEPPYSRPDHDRLALRRIAAPRRRRV